MRQIRGYAYDMHGASITVSPLDGLTDMIIGVTIDMVDTNQAA